jgi:hypothetical protein
MPGNCRHWGGTTHRKGDHIGVVGTKSSSEARGTLQTSIRCDGLSVAIYEKESLMNNRDVGNCRLDNREQCELPTILQASMGSAGTNDLWNVHCQENRS